MLYSSMRFTVTRKINKENKQRRNQKGRMEINVELRSWNNYGGWKCDLKRWGLSSRLNKLSDWTFLIELGSAFQRTAAVQEKARP